MTLRVRALVAMSTAAAVVAVPVAVPTAMAARADTEPPVGSFVLLSSTSTDDPGPLVVEVVQDSLRDNRTPVGAIVREVDWGTGVGYEPWRGDGSIEFTYTSVGRYRLRVRVTDRAGNAAVSLLGTVVVDDSFAPRLRVNRPVSERVERWRSVGGYARDVGLSGMDFVRVKATQKRNRGWFAYLGAGRGWELVPRGRKAARRVAAGMQVGTARNDSWAVPLTGVRAGRLVVQCLAQDLDGNRSKPKVVKRTLAR